MASFKTFLLKAFKNLCSLFSFTITEMHTFFIKRLEYKSSYLARERCFYLLSGMHQLCFNYSSENLMWTNTLQHSS